MSITFSKVTDERTLIDRVRGIGLKTKPDIKPYQDADIRLVSLPTAVFRPASFYVLESGLAFQLRLHAAMIRKLGHSQLELPGMVSYTNTCVDCRGTGMWTKDGTDVKCGLCEGTGRRRWGIIPPVVEMQQDMVQILPQEGHTHHFPGAMTIPVLVDGLHRCMVAREMDLPVTVLLIDRGKRPGIDPYPYYAYPSEWSEVRTLQHRPENPAERKALRTADPYGLYRDFSGLGMSGSRGA